MNQESIAHQLSPSLLKHILCHLFLAAFTTILVSCDLSASPTTLSSPLPTPTSALSSTEIALRQMLVAKVTVLAQIDQTETAARLTPQAKGFKPPSPIFPTEAAIPTAFAPIVGSDRVVSSAGAGYIVIVPSPSITSRKYSIFSQWYEDTNSGKRRIFVEVGAINGPDGSPTAQGIVIVEVWQIMVMNNVVTTALVEHTEYSTPIQAGPVKIVDAVGERLVLQSTTTGNTSYFDVPVRQFVPSLTWVSPISTPSPKLATPEPLVPIPGSTPAGAGAIVNTNLIPPFYSVIENVWYKDTEGGTLRTYVYGTSIPGPGGELAQQGVVVVQMLKMSLKDNRRNLDMVYYKQFPTPTQSGSIHITGAVGERLILQSTSSTIFYFDVPSRQFVPSLTWVSPTSTPGAQPVTPSP